MDTGLSSAADGSDRRFGGGRLPGHPELTSILPAVRSQCLFQPDVDRAALACIGALGGNWLDDIVGGHIGYSSRTRPRPARSND